MSVSLGSKVKGELAPFKGGGECGGGGGTYLEMSQR